ncbi:MAG: serine/threonine-protein phosphatase [Gammaproteobacteria bacterium]|nr:serine/threonine-protein phosphatase [Gammaproteobacteria bacterium]MYF66219.1 serine/threonine-protein phosphatase [Gammaproteobacteria bacterium]MYK38226.1 serine/threonine-protein phosphatase [Gammaproteobacteria bacterium]
MSIRETIEAACLQDIGGRREQQDRVAVLWDDVACLAVLADGLGGHIAGAFAAQTAIDAAREAFDTSPQPETAELLETIVTNAHARIHAAAENDLYPGTTCVLLHATARRATWTHLGDSRLYRFQNGRFVDRTTDHSYPEGGMYACLGAGRELPSIEVRSAHISQSDGFLLCSDGLWESVESLQLEAVFAAQDLPGALRELVDFARSRGSSFQDNISAAAVRLAR